MNDERKVCLPWVGRAGPVEGSEGALLSPCLVPVPWHFLWAPDGGEWLPPEWGWWAHPGPTSYYEDILFLSSSSFSAHYWSGSPFPSQASRQLQFILVHGWGALQMRDLLKQRDDTWSDPGGCRGPTCMDELFELHFQAAGRKAEAST